MRRQPRRTGEIYVGGGGGARIHHPTFALALLLKESHYPSSSEQRDCFNFPLQQAQLSSWLAGWGCAEGLGGLTLPQRTAESTGGVGPESGRATEGRPGCLGRGLFHALKEPSKAHTASSVLVQILGRAVTPTRNPSLPPVLSQVCPGLKAPLKSCPLPDAFPDCQHRG